MNQARAKFKQGVRLVQQDKYEPALEAFEESYRINPKATVLFNIGMCQKALLRYGDAITTFKKLLKESGDEIDPRIRKNAEKDLRIIEDLVGKLYLEGAPSGVKVIVNDNVVASTPLDAPLLLGPGTHSLMVTKDGYQPFNMDVKVTSGSDVVVRVSMRPEESGDGKPVVELSLQEDGRKMPTDSKAKPLLISGIVVGAAGIAGIVVGGVFAGKYSNDLDAANEIADRINTPDERPTDVDDYNTYKDETLPADQAGMIAGFVAGGVALVTGVVLVAIGVKKKKESPVSVLPSAGGVTVRF
jgi:tetratricopeptide (TPR) repeat protein